MVSGSRGGTVAYQGHCILGSNDADRSFLGASARNVRSASRPASPGLGFWPTTLTRRPTQCLPGLTSRSERANTGSCLPLSALCLLLPWNIHPLFFLGAKVLPPWAEYSYAPRCFLSPRSLERPCWKRLAQAQDPNLHGRRRARYIRSSGKAKSSWGAREICQGLTARYRLRWDLDPRRTRSRGVFSTIGRSSARHLAHSPSVGQDRTQSCGRMVDLSS